MGLVEVVGRPIVMLYPLSLVALEVMRLVQLQNGDATVTAQVSSMASWPTPRTAIKPSDLINITKLLLLCYALAQFLSIIAIYSGVGRVMLMIGFVCLLVCLPVLVSVLKMCLEILLNINTMSYCCYLFYEIFSFYAF